MKNDNVYLNLILMYLLPIGFFLLILIVWMLLCYSFSIPEYILPTPVQIGKESVINFKTYSKHFTVTAIESLLGLVIGFTVAALSAIMFVLFKPLRIGLYPFAIALQAVPVVAIAPIVVIWLGSGSESKIFISAIICFFPSLVTMVRGLDAIPMEAEALFRSMAMSNLETLIRLKLPYSVPSALSSIKISSALAVIGTIVGEFAGANEGLGFVILTASYRIETTKMFSAILYSSLLATTLFAILSIVQRAVNRKFNLR